MRYGMRIGKRSWVSGGGGVLAASIVAGLMYWTLVATLYVAFVVTAILVALVTFWMRNTKGARRALLAMPFRGCIDESLLPTLDKKIRLWGVYVVGEEFHSGDASKKGDELIRLYPSKASEIARVAIFPDSTRANGACRFLLRHGYSFSELLRLFPRNFAPADKASRTDVADTMRTQEATSEMNTKRDYTQYRFDGQVVGKGRLVLLLVQRFVADHPDAAFDELRGAFPDNLQAESPTQFSTQRKVVARFGEVEDSERRRFFVGAEDRIAVGQDVVVVSREWNITNIRSVLARAVELGYVVTVEKPT